MDQIRLIVLGNPKPQERHRHSKVPGLSFITDYDPSATKKKNFLSILQENAPTVPLDGSLALELNFFFIRPKGHYGSGKNCNVLKPSAPEWHTGRPDLDNLIKFIQDALNKVYWKDDSIICQLNARKLYSEKPRTEIIITKLL